MSDDLRSSLAAAFEADAAAQAAPVETSAPVDATPPAPEAAPVDTAAATDAIDAGKPGQPRDEHGRFAPKTETTAPTDSAKPEAAAAPVEPIVEPPPAKDTTGKPPIAPPRQWADGAKVKWQRLPREVQEELVKADAQGQYGALNDLIETRRAKFAAKGQTPEQAIGAVLSAWEGLEDPAQRLDTFRWLADAYRIDLTKLAPASTQASPAQPAGEPEYVDPAIAALKQELEETRRLTTALQQQWQTREQQAETQRRTSISAEVQAFRSDPAHSFYDVVEPQMVRLIQASRAAGQEITLQDAYDQAVWANPTTRNELLAQRVQDEQRRREDEAKARAEKAKLAAGSVTGSPTPGASVSGMPPNMDLRSMIASAMANGRV